MSGLIDFHLIFHIIPLIEICACSFYGDYYANFSLLEHHVTSTNISFNDTTLEKSVKKFTSEIQFEKNVRYEVHFQFKDIELIDSKTKLLCEENEKTQECSAFKERQFDVVRGYIYSKENSSFVSGYIKQSFFYGTVFVDNITYSVEDLKNYPEIYKTFKNVPENAIIFKEDLANLPLLQKYIGKESRLTKKPSQKTVDLTNKYDVEKFRYVIRKGNLCSLLVLMDYSFLKLIHKSDVKAAVAQILSSLEEVNSMFRSTDFDNNGEADNIGFYIKYFLILRTEKSSQNIFPKYIPSEIEGEDYLSNFTYHNLLNEVCLGIVFTGQSFTSDTLGMSYTPNISETNTSFRYPIGGICNRPLTYMKGKSLNALAVAPKSKDGHVVSQLILSFCVAHEFGHSFGSFHDESKECLGHLMMPHTPSDSKRKRFIFSECSKTVIMKTIVYQGHCFESDRKQFCGNGLIEEEESCDCGTIRDCKIFDACCTPRGQDNSCGVRKSKSVDCHPSQGICCTAKCRYNDLSAFNLDCRNFEKKCPCKESESHCTCGVGGICSADVCSSIECARISLTECSCPRHASGGKCQTCCSYKDTCVPARIISEQLIRDNRNLIHELKNFENSSVVQKNDQFGFFQKMCVDNICTELYFHTAKPRQYCLLHGSVGTCNSSFQCSIPKAKKVFPSLRIFRDGTSDTKSCSESFMPFDVYNLLFLLVWITFV